jgi:hypothetical protein
MAFILLCVSVIILCAPGRAPWTQWIAGALAIAALILALVGTRGASVFSEHAPPPVPVTQIT